MASTSTAPYKYQNPQGVNFYLKFNILPINKKIIPVIASTSAAPCKYQNLRGVYSLMIKNEKKIAIV